MPVLRNLSEEEINILMHKIKSSNRKLGDTCSEALLDEMTL